MRGLVLLFLVVLLSIIAWGYVEGAVKKQVVAVFRKNLFAIIAASLVVAIAVAVSTNTTLRLV